MGEFQIPERVVEAAARALFEAEGDPIADSLWSFHTPAQIALQAALKEWGVEAEETEGRPMMGFPPGIRLVTPWEPIHGAKQKQGT